MIAMEREFQQELTGNVVEKFPKNISEMSKDEWENYVLGSHLHQKWSTYQRLRNNLGQRIFPNTQIYRRQGKEYEILNRLYSIEQKLDLVYEEGATDENSRNSRNLANSYRIEKNQFLRNTAREIRSRRQYHILPKLRDEIFSQSRSYLPATFIMGDICALYLIVCDRERLLVGMKDRLLWKRVDLNIHEGDLFPIEPYVLPYLSQIDIIGERELVVVPDKLVHPSEIGRITISTPSKSTEELLEDAYYRQRYIIPPEGAEIRFRNAGDIQKVVMMQWGSGLLAKTSTTQGDILSQINLKTAVSTSSEQIPEVLQGHIADSKIVNVLAEVYRDLVTAVEIPTSRYNSLGRRKVSSKPDEIGPEQRPQVIYIPRVVRTGQKPEVRLPYDGPERPITPHRVEGHRRRANMTEEHRQRLLQFEREYEIKILENLPAGFTFVRPHFVPADAGESLRDLPIFIKKRIETRFTENLQRPTS